ncbi:MAG TPA: hypothetical protein VGM17_03365, partial [Rhizomicrobium sp.]
MAGEIACAILAGATISANAKPAITTFDPPGSIEVLPPLSINASGAIVGSYGDQDDNPRGFIRNPDGSFTDFDPDGSVATDMYGTDSINDSGVITGSYRDDSFVLHGFIRSADGTIISFDPAGSTETVAMAVNKRGVITGWYLDSNS